MPAWSHRSWSRSVACPGRATGSCPWSSAASSPPRSRASPGCAGPGSRSRGLFRRLATMVVVLAVLGCTTYVLFPAAPPWLAAQRGLLPPVDRLVAPVGTHVPVITLAPLWETGTQYANAVAAVPSLHASYTLLIAWFLFARLRSHLRYLLWLYPLAMAFALVYSGEHYVVDVLLGWLYCVAVYLAVERLAARCPHRRIFRLFVHSRKSEPSCEYH